MKLETERLILREFEKRDLNELVKNINNLQISKWLLTVAYPYTKKDGVWWVNKNLKWKKQKDREQYNFVLQLKDKTFIGSMGFVISKQHKTGDIGYWLGEGYWRKGYGSEALEKILEFGFKKLKLRKIEAKVFEGNPSSGKLLENFGFKLEGRHPESVICKADGKIRTDLSYGLLKKDWEKKK